MTGFIPDPVATAGFTIDLTAVVVALLAMFGAVSGGVALVRKARIEADAQNATQAGSREAATWDQWVQLVQQLRIDLDRVSSEAATANTRAADAAEVAQSARRSEREWQTRHNELRAEFDTYRADTERHVTDLEDRIRVLQRVIQALTDDRDRAELLASDPETLAFLSEGDDDGESRESDPV